MFLEPKLTAGLKQGLFVSSACATQAKLKDVDKKEGKCDRLHTALSYSVGSSDLQVPPMSVNIELPSIL